MIDIPALLQYTKSNIFVKGLPTGANEQRVATECPCDVLFPAALEGQITEKTPIAFPAKFVLKEPTAPRPLKRMLSWQRGIKLIRTYWPTQAAAVSYFEWVQDRYGHFWKDKSFKMVTASCGGRTAASARSTCEDGCT